MNMVVKEGKICKERMYFFVGLSRVKYKHALWPRGPSLDL